MAKSSTSYRPGHRHPAWVAKQIGDVVHMNHLQGLPAGRPHVLTKEEEKKVIEAYKDGTGTIRQLADMYGVSKSTIGRLVR